jgi:hypothetical protein
MGLDIIMFWFMNDWGMYGRAYEKIAENLATMPEVSRVMVFFPPLEKQSASWPEEKVKVENISQKLVVVTLYDVLQRGSHPMLRVRRLVNDKVASFSFRRCLRALIVKKENTILWLYPSHGFINQVISKIPYTFLVTQIIDNSSFMTIKHNKAKLFSHEQYKNLAETSDVVITSSRANYDIFSQYNKQCGFFENAVDTIFIMEPSELPYRINNCRPRLGYVGFISERTDLVLLEHIAKQRPNYDLIIAGPISTRQNIDNLVKIPNVSYVGAIPYDELPRFIKTLDVCLIAHKDTEYSRTMSPLKAYQYLGSGRPIVSTRVAGVEKFNGLIWIAETYNDFLECIDESVHEGDSSLKHKRIGVAKHENWQKRARDIFQYVHGCYLQKEARGRNNE